MDERDLKKINKAALRFMQPSTLEETYKIIVKEAISLVGGKYGSIFLREKGEFRRVYTSWLPLYNAKLRKKAHTYKAFIERQPLIVHVSTMGKTHPELVNEGIKTSVFIPLSVHKKSIGVLIIPSQRIIEYDKKDMELLKLFGSMATLAIQKMQSFTQTRNALETRDSFISMVVHELRTPLAVINGYTQLLQSRIKKEKVSESKWIDNILRENKRMSEVINELVDLTRIKTGKTHYVFKEINIIKVIERSVLYFKELNSERIVTLHNKKDLKLVKVIGDVDKLFQVFNHLLENSIKFSSSEKPVDLQISRDNSEVIIKLIDQGIGIPKKLLPDIFKGFKKVNPVGGSLGVGLYIVKNIISKHKGSIGVNSTELKGTTFTIKLPIAKL